MELTVNVVNNANKILRSFSLISFLIHVPSTNGYEVPKFENHTIILDIL
jgi:hypothetical protein